MVTFTLIPEQPELHPEERDYMAGILKHDMPERYHLWVWVVMNDHVHAVLTPQRDWQLSQILHTWKSFSANQLQRKFNRRGQIWLHESHDRLIRDEEELRQKCNYVLTNPQRRWPEVKEYPWCGYEWM